MSRKIFAWVTFPEAAFEGKIGLKIEPLVKLSFREGGKIFLANYTPLPATPPETGRAGPLAGAVAESPFDS
ncbi:MAG: hypothetical protein AB1801_01695 [Chloroflexota bacterium]